jgi:hypothetical protein
MAAGQARGGNVVKFLSSFMSLFIAGSRQSQRHEGEHVRWATDPLSHPALDTMSERELGDVPFRLTARRTDHETAARQAAACGGGC